MIKDSGERRQFSTGAVRDIQYGKGRADLLPLDVIGKIEKRYDQNVGSILLRLDMFQKYGDYDLLFDILKMFADLQKTSVFEEYLEVSKHFEEGANKYAENNWKKGIPVRCYIDSATRHFLKYLAKYDDEPHDRAFIWNILCCIWTCIHKPELNTYQQKEDKE